MDWELVNPEGPSQSTSVRPAARLGSLSGKTIGLSWNGKPGGKEVLEEIARLVQQRFEGAKFIRYWEAVPESWAVALRELDEATIARMASCKPDLVITAQGD